MPVYGLFQSLRVARRVPRASASNSAASPATSRTASAAGVERGVERRRMHQVLSLGVRPAAHGLLAGLVPEARHLPRQRADASLPRSTQVHTDSPSRGGSQTAGGQQAGRHRQTQTPRLTGAAAATERSPKSASKLASSSQKRRADKIRASGETFGGGGGARQHQRADSAVGFGGVCAERQFQFSEDSGRRQTEGKCQRCACRPPSAAPLYLGRHSTDPFAGRVALC